jgi:hypothetical protein
MRRILEVITVISIVSLCGLAQAEELQIFASENTIQLDYINDIRLMDMEGNKLSFGIFLDEDRDIIGNATVIIPGQFKDQMPIPLSFSFGGKAYLALLNEPENEDVFALAPGVGARFDIPIDIGMPMNINADLFYAPEILVFGDAKDVLEFTTRFEIDLFPQLTGFAGYRILRFDIEGTGTKDFDDRLHIGLRYRF